MIRSGRIAATASIPPLAAAVVGRSENDHVDGHPVHYKRISLFPLHPEQILIMTCPINL